MKKLRLFLLIALLVIGQCWPVLATDVMQTSGELTADATVTTGTALLCKVHVMSSGSSTATAVIYDNTAGSGKKIRTLTAAASDTDGTTESWSPGVAALNGLYVTISNGYVVVDYIPIGGAGSGSTSSSTKLDDLGSPDDNTDLNASTSAHGLLPKLSGSSSEYLDGTGNYSSVSAAGTKLDDLASPDDNTDLNASSSAHGLLPKLPGNSSEVLRGDGTWGSVSTTQVWNKEFALINPSSSDDGLWFRVSSTMTVSAVHAVVDPADSSESVVMDVLECNSDGDSCTSILSSTITAANTDTAGTVSDTTLTAGNWIRVDIGTVTGTVTRANLTMNGTY
jgi:hypothetical protein